jgi:ribonuclease P protein component
MAKKFTLRASERLKGRKLMERVFKTGTRWNKYPLRVSYIIDDETVYGYIKFGCSAPVRNFKKAVDRNRVKRLMKEAFRLKKHLLVERLKQKNARLVIFVIYTAPGLPKFVTIKTAIDELVLKLKEEIEGTKLLNN